ncbi:unnamed protein product, partial [Choristocarpus tenellus]
MPNFSRQDRQLLMLRFLRDEDESVPYQKFLNFCLNKSESQENLRCGFTAALAATWMKYDALMLVGIVLLLPLATQGLQKKMLLTAALSCSRPNTDMGTTISEGERVGEHQSGRKDSILSRQSTINGLEEAETSAKVAALIGEEDGKMRQVLEQLFEAKDAGGCGSVHVKAFSECLRQLVQDIDQGGGGVGKESGVEPQHGKGLTRADRKRLYRKWAVHGQVRYADFLRA